MKSIWTIISAIAGLLAVAVTVYIFWQDREDSRMRLRVELVTQSALIDQNVSKTGKDIQIMYNGRRIENFAIYLLRISNPGGRPIRSNDFEESVAINFTGVDEIVSAQQTGAEPRSVKISPQVRNLSVLVPATLLNPGDSCGIEIAVIPSPGQAPKLDISGRVAGIREVEFATSRAPDPLDKEWLERVLKIQVWTIVAMLALTFGERVIRWVRGRIRREY